mgnify:FL=1
MFPLAGVLPSGEYLVCATVNSTHNRIGRYYVVIVRSSTTAPPLKQMGASNSKIEDASLALAVPKHITVFNHRLLDPFQRQCKRCSTSCFGARHYCRRCGDIVCEQCTTMRHYKQSRGHGFRICTKCSPCRLTVLPEAVWHVVWSFLDVLDRHRCLQSCHRFQVCVPLPFHWGQRFESFFSTGTFLAKGANGSVFRTTLLGQGRQVAVKVVSKVSIYSVRKWTHVMREIDVLRLCRHPNVIELVDVFQSPDDVYIALEYASGGDLFDWLTHRRSTSETTYAHAS